MSKLEEQLNEQTLQGTVSVNDQNLQQALIETAVLDDLNDVNISNPTDGQALSYQASTNSWQNVTIVIPNGDKGDITTSGGGSTWTIDNNAVVESKINAGAVTETKIGTGAVTETKITDNAVTENKVANNAITVNKIANDSVTNSKLANMATATVKGRATAGTGDPEDLAIDNDLSTVSVNDDTIPSAKAVKDYVDILELKTKIRNAGLINGYIRTTVASNNLTIAVSTSPTSQVDPTVSNPVYVWIGGVLRSITSSLTFTRNGGTSSLNMGSAELATKEVDLFPYLQWNTTTSAVNLLASRIPSARKMSSFVNSATDEKGVLGIVNYNSNDDVVLVDRFSATSNSSNNFTATGNIYGEPIYETRWFSPDPVVVGFSGTPTKNMRCRLQMNTLQISFDISGTSNATNFTVTSPFIFNNPSASNNVRPGFSEDNGTALAASRVDFVNGTRIMNIFSSGGAGAWTASGPKRAMAQFFVEI